VISSKNIPFECVNIPYFVSDDVFDSGNTLDMIKKSIRKSTMFPFLR
jgi:hypoxanthine-guanine phosphoribosyltransferase